MKQEGLQSLHGIRECVMLADHAKLVECIEKVFAGREYKQHEIAALHDDLLFAMAYAPSAEIYEGCKTALRLLPELIRPGSLNDSGISGSIVTSSFSFKLLKWMNEHFPGSLFFHSFSDEEEDIGELMAAVLPPAESEICSYGYAKNKLFTRLCGGKISADKIIALFSSAENDRIRDLVFMQLGLFVELHLKGNTISRTNASSPVHPNHYHTEILKRIDHHSIINKHLPRRRKLEKKQTESLVANARMMLASLGRETDPVTFCNEQETEYYVLDRGFSIALFTLDPQHRLAFDSYIGFMMYKNGLPVAYGGAWLFVHRALIGINIFEPYRGGESSFLFAQLLRVYHQRYKANRFSVEPYQYGKDNPEGIASGAYWFYYRFGFRSDDPQLAQLAEEEQKKLRADKHYKTPPAILKKFIKSNISVGLKEGRSGIDPALLSLRISAVVASEFGGDRKKAIRHGHAIMRNFLRSEISVPKNELLRKIFDNWCLAFLVLQPAGKAGKKDKFTFIKMLRAKASGTEADYIKFIQTLRSWL